MSFESKIKQCPNCENGNLASMNELAYAECYQNLKFKCKIKKCSNTLTFEQVIDSEYHKDCPNKRYQCILCKEKVKYEKLI